MHQEQVVLLLSYFSQVLHVTQDVGLNGERGRARARARDESGRQLWWQLHAVEFFAQESLSFTLSHTNYVLFLALTLVCLSICFWIDY